MHRFIWNTQKMDKWSDTNSEKSQCCWIVTVYQGLGNTVQPITFEDQN